MAQKLTDDKKGNSTGFGRGWPDPSPILDDDVATAQCSIRTRGPLMPDPGPGEVPAAAAAPPPVLLEIEDPPPR